MQIMTDFLARCREVAPSLLNQIEMNSRNYEWDYIWAQILLLHVRGHVPPLEEYAPMEGVDKAVLDRRDSTMDVYRTGSPQLSRVTLLGTSKGCLFLGQDAVLRNVLINTSRGYGVIVLGPNVELSDMVIQMSGTNSLVIASGTTIPHGNIYIAEDGNFAIIGDDCMFSNNVAMRTTDSHAIFDRSTGRRINQGRPVIIHNHAWIGRHVMINKGTEVETDAVVGQGAVTSGRLRGATIHAGHPAKPLRENITWDRTTAETMEQALVVDPSRRRAWQHLRFCERIDGLASTSPQDLSLLHLLSRILAAGMDQAAAKNYAAALTGTSAEDRQLVEEAVRLRSLVADVGTAPFGSWQQVAAAIAR